MDYDQVAEFTDIELRNEATSEQIQYLKEHPSEWGAALRVLKRKAETQMTSHNTRVFTLHVAHNQGKLSRDEYYKDLSEEKVWKTGANRFLQAVETKMMALKYELDS